MEWTLNPTARLEGELAVPGDKSIGHRALILGAIAEGRTELSGLPTGEDVASTAAVVRALGAVVDWSRDEHGARARIEGGGLRGLRRSPRPLDCGNSGTTMRLMAGLLAGQAFPSTLTGDASLRRRPMGRVAEPLRAMGAAVTLAGGEKAPIELDGARLRGVTYRPPIASAQVKSCVLLAGLYAEGPTQVIEVRATRDHTERMLRAAGVEVGSAGGEIGLDGGARLAPLLGRVPGDLSSAAYLVAAAAVVPGSRVRMRAVGVNPTRSALLDVLTEWGARIERAELEPVWGEPVADLTVHGAESPLSGGAIAPDRVPILIDELPLLGLLAPLTREGMEVRGAEELRVKESDRIETTCAAVRALGGEVEEYPDGFAVRGGTGLDSGLVEARGDHRIALSVAAVAVAARGPLRVAGAEAAAVSWPGFEGVLVGLAAR